MHKIFRFAVLFVPLWLSEAAVAHHSFLSDFHADREATLQGKVIRVWFKNPHIRYEIETAPAAGSTAVWELQWHNITLLRNRGWDKDSLDTGDRVEVEGNLGRNDEKKLFIKTVHWVEKADGTRIAYAGDKLPAVKPVAPTGSHTDYETMPSGHPINITGLWDNGYKFRVTVDDLEPKPVPFTEEGRRIYAGRRFGDDEVLRCLPMGLPRIFGSPQHMEIVDATTHYLFIYGEQNTPRWIWMDGRRPAGDTPPTSMGFSSGRWEGDKLIIETTHLSPGWLDGSGLPMSGEGTRLVETYTLSADRLTMDRIMVIHDPLYTAPMTRVRGSSRGKVEAVELPPCDPESFYRDLWKKDLLESRFK